ncbi:hypothetical protein GCM10022240_21290 [Microbacterium kribbense]|uniref:DUF559 domain-containing protein n=1 Tax=Microbacterium kribbense TaxID=433645 RepID=A0ABP7GLN3_9MICO
MATPKKTAIQLAETVLPATFLSPAGLAAQGFSRRQVAARVSAGDLIRLRKGRYIAADTDVDLVRAGGLGARLDCISLLSTLGVFVHTSDDLHVQVEQGASRLPLPAKGIIRHWRASGQDRSGLATGIVDALAQACRCQPPREAIATLDSAWHHGLVDEEKITAVFALLPRRLQRLRPLLDKRAESGPETLMRLLLRALGCHVEVQVRIRAVGRVDFVVDGWLIIECDSEAHHSGWTAQKRDRRRDIAAAAQGYTTIRPIAEDILYRRDEVLDRIRHVLATPAPRPAVQNSSHRVRRTKKAA